MIALEAKKLTKRFGQKTAVDSLDLQAEKGELLALLGVNGAGKTTTVRMFTCLSRPTEGEAFVNGMSVLTEQTKIKEIVGISPQDTAVSPLLTVRENLEMMARVCGEDAAGAKAAAGKMIALFRMEKEENTRAKTLSGGWQRRLSIAMALIGDPEVLFLDEPTLGLDVLARRELWQVIRALKGTVTVVLTTHYMEEAEALADRIAVMADGHLLTSGTLEELEKETGETGLENAFIALVKRRGGNE